MHVFNRRDIGKTVDHDGITYKLVALIVDPTIIDGKLYTNVCNPVIVPIGEAPTRPMLTPVD